jgi:hypothetical protein
VSAAHRAAPPFFDLHAHPAGMAGEFGAAPDDSVATTDSGSATCADRDSLGRVLVDGAFQTLHQNHSLGSMDGLSTQH